MAFSASESIIRFDSVIGCIGRRINAIYRWSSMLKLIHHITSKQGKHGCRCFQRKDFIRFVFRPLLLEEFDCLAYGVRLGVGEGD